MARRWFKRVGRDFVEVIRPGNWTIGRTRQLDGRSADEKEIAELMLRGTIGRTRPMMYGERTPDVMRKIIAECRDNGDDHE
jgi:hypothetical protein